MQSEAAVQSPDASVLERAHALAHLDQAAIRLETLAKASLAGSAQQYHRAVAVVHDLCDGITSCLAAGVPDADLRARVASARAIHGRSPFVERLQQWPRGYAGDFETIEWLWTGENRAPGGTLARALESYALTSPIAQQHRNRVAFQAESLLRTFASGRPCRVLSLGCGGNPDLRTVLDRVPSTARFVLCDADPEALVFSRDKLGAVADQCTFVLGMVPRVLRRVVEYGPFDLVMARGLFDYLPDRFVSCTVADVWHKALGPGGRLLFTNIARDNLSIIR